MDYIFPDHVVAVLTALTDKGFEAYVVGGAIRDLIMNKPVTDWDFTTNAPPEEIQNVFPDSFYDNAFGTVGVVNPVEGEAPFEITTFRREFGYSDSRRPDTVEWGTSLEEDLSRRDFTINAIAGSQSDGKLVFTDPFGGTEDIKQKLVRAVGDPHERFREDALRLMRAVRIASQLGFEIEEKTLEAVTSSAPLINHIARERVRDEFFKLLVSQYAEQGVLLLRNCGLLQEILPELEKTFGVEQKSPNRHHIYDVGTHSVKALSFCKSTDPIVRFATLIHDIGKAQTFKKLTSGVITFYNHEMVGANIARRIADRLRLSTKQKEKLVKLVRWHQFTVDEHQTDSAIRRFITNVGIENVEDMLVLRVADRLGGGSKETSWRLEEFKARLVEVQKQPFSVRDLKIDGSQIMELLGISPGKKVGEILQALFSEVEEQKLQNEYEVLKTRVTQLIEEVQ